MTGPSLRAPIEQLGGAAEVVRAEDDVDVPGALEHELAVLLRQAAADGDLEVGACVLECLELPEVAVQLVVGVLPDAARVEHDDVGVVDGVGGLQSLRRQEAGDALESCSFIWHP